MIWKSDFSINFAPETSKRKMNDTDKYKLRETTVAVVDDHEVVLEGLKSYLAKSGIGDVEAFARADALFSRMRLRRFDIYIIDIEMPDTTAEELIENIHSLQPDAKIIVNTIHEEMWVVSKMMEKHVDGVLYKSAHLEQVIEAVLAVSTGQQYFCKKFRQSQSRLQHHNEILTKREIDVLKAIANGLSTKEIAASFFISENTVESHRQNLFRKLDTPNMASLIVKAIAAGYIDPEELVKT